MRKILIYGNSSKATNFTCCARNSILTHSRVMGAGAIPTRTRKKDFSLIQEEYKEFCRSIMPEGLVDKSFAILLFAQLTHVAHYLTENRSLSSLIPCPPV